MLGEAVAFDEMKVAQLKEELAARGSSRTGAKGMLQQRLHTLIVSAAAERVRAEAEADGGV